MGKRAVWPAAGPGGRGRLRDDGVPSRVRVPCSLGPFGPRIPRPLLCPSHGGCSATVSTHGVPWAQQLPGVGGLGYRSRSGWVFVPRHWLAWSLPCPEVPVGLKGEAALGPSLRRASEPEAGRVGIGHSPGPGLHPQDPDLEGGPGCAEAQSSLKHRFSCAFWTKSPPQPLPSGQPCPAAPGPGKTLCKVI